MQNQNQNDNRGIRKERVGVVLSDKMQKTIVVQIRRKALHPEYGKVIEKANKFKVHDEKNEAKIGDRVRIVETRPMSKDKRWRLVEIISRGRASAEGDLKETAAQTVKVKKAAIKSAPEVAAAGVKKS